MITSDWKNIFESNNVLNDINTILDKIDTIYKKTVVYPEYKNIFRALNLTPFKNVKVVIIGQDPYHEINQANGLAFSLNEDVDITPSLRNIFKELKSDTNIDRTNKDLSGWAKQGVLLLNTILTVEEGKALSHSNIGWENITSFIIKYISENKENVVFILWGNNAKKLKNIIDSNKHFIIESVHPSPLSASRGFFGSKPFSKTNKYLQEKNQSVIDWSL